MVQPVAAPTSTARSRYTTPAWTILPPLLACVVARWWTVTQYTGVGFFDFGPTWWARYDSGNYVSIVREGYYWSSCAARHTPQFGPVCSNTTWYPGYPYLVKVATWFGFPLATSATVIAVAFWVATIVALWVWFLRDAPRVRALGCLAIAAFFPGVVYLQALFPISMLTFFMVLSIRFMLRRNWWGAGLAAGVAGFVYPIGVVLVPVMFLWVLLVRGDLEWIRRFVVAVGVAALALSGTVAVFVIQQVQVGHWDASLTMQEKLGTTLLFPLRSLVTIVVHETSTIQTLPGHTGHVADAIARQTLLVAVLVTAIVAAYVVSWVRARTVDRNDLALVVLFVLVWLLPLSSFIDTGIYRREATLLPMAMLAKRLPTPVVVVFAVACVFVAGQMSRHYFDYLLI